jgi:hypothetical protein
MGDAPDSCPHVARGDEEAFAVVTLRALRRSDTRLVNGQLRLCVSCAGRVAGALREAAELVLPGGKREGL